MQIIPVIDLLGGHVVRGVGGRRSEYEPVVSRLSDSASPTDIATTFVGFGLRTVYVADLDAILGGALALHHYEAIARAGATMWIDAGVSSVTRAREIVGHAHCVVVGSETLHLRAALVDMFDELQERIVFSLDLKNGEVLTHVPEWQSQSPLDVVKDVVSLGISKIIVLDLARVGEGEGVGTEMLCREIRTISSKLKLIAGGGVRDAADLDSLSQAGCDAVLVASALHDGRLLSQDKQHSN